MIPKLLEYHTGSISLNRDSLDFQLKITFRLT